MTDRGGYVGEQLNTPQLPGSKLRIESKQGLMARHKEGDSCSSAICLYKSTSTLLPPLPPSDVLIEGHQLLCDQRWMWTRPDDSQTSAHPADELI